MRSLGCLAVLAISFSSTVLAHALPSPSEEPSADARQDFQDLINALPEESLQAALHGHVPQFKDGVFESSRRGLEKVHEKNPRLASRLIVAAVQDLKKRHTPPSDGNSTVTGATDTATPTSATQPPSSDNSIPSSSPTNTPSSPASSAPPSLTGPSSITPTIRPQTSEPPESSPTPNTSAVVSVVTTNSKGNTVTTKETVPAVVVTTTNSAGRTVKSTSALTEEQPSIITTPIAVPTTDQKGSTVLTTITPTAGVISSKIIITEAGPEGPRTVTSYTYVPAADATGQKNGETPSATTKKPGLQPGAAVPGAVVGAGLWGVAGVMVMLL